MEHRLFGPISQNWRGVPLRTLDTLLGYIRHTTTNTGLKVTAKLDRRTYRQKIKVKDREMNQLNLRRQRTRARSGTTPSARELIRIIREVIDLQFLSQGGLPIAYRAVSSDAQGGSRTRNRSGLSRAAQPIGVPGRLHFSSPGRTRTVVTWV